MKNKPYFICLINNLIMGTVFDHYVDFILNRCLDKMDDETRQQFRKYAMNIVLNVPALSKRGNLFPWSAPVARVHPWTADHC